MNLSISFVIFVKYLSIEPFESVLPFHLKIYPYFGGVVAFNFYLFNNFINIRLHRACPKIPLLECSTLLYNMHSGGLLFLYSTKFYVMINTVLCAILILSCDPIFSIAFCVSFILFKSYFEDNEVRSCFHQLKFEGARLS